MCGVQGMLYVMKVLESIGIQLEKAIIIYVFSPTLRNPVDNRLTVDHAKTDQGWSYAYGRPDQK